MNIRKLLAILYIILFSIFVYFYIKNYSYIRQQIGQKIYIIMDKNSENPDKFSVILSEKEREFLISNLKTSKQYLEFGSGGSTFLALLNSDANVVSVENDKKWINHLRGWKIIKKNEGNRLKFYFANTGKIVDYGRPADPENDKELFTGYCKDVYEKYKNNYDLVFIDGRFRVACTLQTILNTDDNIKILMHDFTYRPHYNDILNFLTIEKTVDTMVLFKKKQNIDKEKVAKMYENYKYDFR